MDWRSRIPPGIAPVLGGGYSLVELMVALTIVAILMVIGVPSFASLIRESALTTATNDFFSSINLARMAAIQRGVRVDMAPLDEAGDWARGWSVFVDENGNRRRDEEERLVFLHGPVAPGIVITSQLTDSSMQYLAYNAAGRSRTNTSNYRTQFGTFTFVLQGQSRKIKLNFLGRPRICNPELDRLGC